MGAYKNFLAVFLGCIAGIIVVFIGEYSLGYLYPLPAGIDFHNKEAMGAAIASMPLPAFLILLFIHVLASFSGGIFGTIVSDRTKIRPALSVGVALTIVGLYNIWLLPHPTWFIIVNALVYIPSAYIGYVVAKKKTITSS